MHPASAPGDDAPVELQDPVFQATQLTAESSQARASHLGHPTIVWIGDDLQELLDTTASNRSNYPEVSKIAEAAHEAFELVVVHFA